MSVHTHKSLTDAILETIAYSDIFEYPLTTPEIHRYLTFLPESLEMVQKALELDGPFVRTGEYFSLPGRQEIVSIRMQREAHSRKLVPLAIRYGRILGCLPFVRMVALTGSLAVLNLSKNADFDYMLVTKHGRVWTARAFAVMFNRLAKRFGHTLCPNLIVSEKALEWPLHDLYSARELCQMIPITGMQVYRKLMIANVWAREFLPNAYIESDRLPLENQPIWARVTQRLYESLLGGKPGDRFERWEMNRKIARFSKQAGFGEETIFTAEVCQGNFHHHRQWTREVFEDKLSTLAAARSRESAIASEKA